MASDEVYDRDIHHFISSKTKVVSFHFAFPPGQLAARFIIRVHPHPIPFSTLLIVAPAPTSLVFSSARIEAAGDNGTCSLPAIPIIVSRLKSDF
jgi:hypothetical protein